MDAWVNNQNPCLKFLAHTVIQSISVDARVNNKKKHKIYWIDGKLILKFLSRSQDLLYETVENRVFDTVSTLCSIVDKGNFSYRWHYIMTSGSLCEQGIWCMFFFVIHPGIHIYPLGHCVSKWFEEWVFFYSPRHPQISSGSLWDLVIHPSIHR